VAAVELYPVALGLDRNVRWKKVAHHVGHGRSKKECFDAFKELCTQAKEKQKLKKSQLPLQQQQQVDSSSSSERHSSQASGSSGGGGGGGGGASERTSRGDGEPTSERQSQRKGSPRVRRSEQFAPPPSQLPPMSSSSNATPPPVSSSLLTEVSPTEEKGMAVEAFEDSLGDF
jgi:hypothetical protein